MTTNVETIDKKSEKVLLKIFDILVSRTSTSLPNLLMILPWGVVSKKDNGVLNMFSNIRLCSALAPFNVDINKNKDAIIVVTAWPSPKRA